MSFVVPMRREPLDAADAGAVAGRPRSPGRQPAPAPAASTASGCSSSKAACSDAHGLLDAVLGDDRGDPDLRRGDHLDVDPGVGERPEHAGRVARRVVDAGPDDRDLGDRRSPWSCPGTRGRGSSGSRIRFAFASSTRGMVNDRSVAPPWPTFWTIMSTLMPASASGPNTLRRDARLVGHVDQRDLGDVPVVGDPPDLVPLLHERVLPDLRAGRVLERAEDLDDDVVDPAELDGPDLHHLGALVGELHHLLVADDGELAGVRGDPRVRGVDALDVREDLAAVRLELRRERDRRGVRAAAAERGDLGGVDVAAAGRVLQALERRRRSCPGSPATMTTLPAASSAADAPRVDAGDARPAVAAVRGDARPAGR